MGYIKNYTTWTSANKITTTELNNFETQYSESSSHLSSHVHTSDYYTKSEMLATFWGVDNDGSGSGADADLIYYSGGNLHIGDFDGLSVPTGLIIMWSGETVPTGWHLCDGTSGTVDLRDRFVVGAGTGSDYNVGDTGSGTHTIVGAVTISGHSLSAAEISGHQHAMADMSSRPNSGGCGYNSEGSGSQHPNAYYNEDTTGNSDIGKSTADPHTHSSSFSSDPFTITPMYYSLKFIQKIAA